MASTLEQFKERSQMLACLVQDSFGPNGRDIALKTSSGNILITNSGSECLKAFQGTDCVYRLLIEQTLKFHDIAGDLSKSLILILDSILGRLVNIAGEEPSYDDKHFTQWEIFHCLTRISFRSDCIIDELQQCTFNYSTKLVSKDQLCNILKRISTSALNGVFSSSTVQLLETLVLNLLKKSVVFNDNAMEQVRALENCFSDVCIELYGISPDFSTIVEGTIIERELLSYDKNQTIDGCCRFLIFKCDPGKIMPKSNCVISVMSSGDVSQLLSLRRRFLHDLLNVIQTCNIKLLIFQDALDHNTRTLFMKYAWVVHSVPESRIETICKLYEVKPIEDVVAVKENYCFHPYVGTALFCREFLLGNRKVTHLGCPLLNGKSLTAKYSIALCAPSAGLAVHYVMAMRNLLKVIRMSLRTVIGKGDRSTFICVVPGAGMSEFLLANALLNEAERSSCSKMKQILNAISSGFQSVPRALYNNSISHHGCETRFIEIETVVRNAYLSGMDLKNQFYGINSTSGELLSSNDCDLQEPFASKILLLHTVLESLRQITKIESITHIKRNKELAEEKECRNISVNRKDSDK